MKKYAQRMLADAADKMDDLCELPRLPHPPGMLLPISPILFYEMPFS